MQNESDYNDDFITIDLSKHLFDVGMFVATFIFALLYYLNAGFRDWLFFNLDHITVTLDLHILTYGIIIIPFIVYWVYFILRIIAFFWQSQEASKTRAIFRIVRAIYSISGFFLILLSVSLRVPALSTWPLLVAFGTGIPILLFLDYPRIFEEEKKLYQGISKPSVSIFQLVMLAPILLYIVLYYSNIEFTIFVDEIYAFICADFPLLILFWIWVSFGILWFFLDFIFTSITAFLRSHEGSILTGFKIIYLICFAYYVMKIFMFNIPYLIPEPYPSMISFAGSVGGGLISRYIPSLFKKNKPQ